jgi:hypothetical protein
VPVAQKLRRVEIYSRTAEGWRFAATEPPADEVVLAAVDARLSLETICEGSGR